MLVCKKLLLDIVNYGACCKTIPEYRPDLPNLLPLLPRELPRPYLHLRLSVLLPAVGFQGPNGHIGNCAYYILKIACVRKAAKKVMVPIVKGRKVFSPWIKFPFKFL